MAILSSPINYTSLQKNASVAVKGAVTAGKAIQNVSKIILNNRKVKRSSYATTKLLKDRRLENERRKIEEDALEAADIVVKKGGSEVLAQKDTSKGFLERIIGFIGYLSAGWLINNLPTWIAIGKEFVARLKKAGKIMSDFYYDTIGIFTAVSKVFKNLGQELLRLDFSDSTGGVKSAIDELNAEIENWTLNVEEALGLVTTPLTEGKVSGQSAPPLGTEVTTEGAYETTRTYESTGGEKIVDVGGKDYGDYIPGGIGSRGSSRVHGAGGERGHTGEDYAMPIGTPLTMIAKGTVVDVGLGYNGGYGNFVVIQLDTGEYVKLAHLDSVNVKKGDKVGAGSGSNGTAKVIGFSGKTGLGTGAHLHIDYAKSYDSATAFVSGTMNPASFINGGGLVRGGNVKSTGEVTSQTAPSGKPGAPGGTTTIPSGGTLSSSQLVALAKQVGMTQQVNVSGYSGPLDVLMAAVGMQESRGNTRSMRSDTQVYGLWQIRWPVHASNLKKLGITSPEQLYDPVLNAKAAKMIYESQGITAWSGFTDGNYKKFLPEAQKAAGTPAAAPSTTSTPPSAEIASSQQQQQIPGSITPDRKSQDILVSQPPSQQNIITPSGGGQSFEGQSSLSDFDMLNNYMKNKLLLDLAYL